MKGQLKRYFKTLWFALIGCNPYQVEMDALHECLGAASRDVTRLKELYCDLLDLTSKSNRQLSEVEQKLADADKRQSGYQKLVENLRTRITEKDMILAQTKKEYQKRIDAYNIEIDHLRNELLKYKREQAQ